MKRVLLLPIVLVAILSAGCGGVVQTGSGTSATAVPNNSNTEQDDAAVSSGGTIVSPQETDGNPGTGQGGAGSPPSVADATVAPPSVPGSWQTLTDEALGISLAYPPEYVRYSSGNPLSAGQLGEINFLTKQIAASQTANLQPPEFGVAVFANPENLTIEQWLEKNVFQPGRQFEQTPTTVGGVPGIHLATDLTIAPGEFVYVSANGRIYRFTLLGEFASEMLASVRFIP